MTVENEQKYISLQKNLSFSFETKEDEKGEFGYVKGYGAVFDNVDRGYDMIEKGAFSEIKNRIKMLYQHRDLIGIWKTCYEDNKGLIVEGEINLSTQLGKEAYSLLKQGALTDLSVGFKTKEWDYVENGSVRRIKKAELFEVSLVSIPMNTKANVLSVKSIDEIDEKIDAIETKRDFERVLRDFGLSQNQTKTLISKGFSAFQRDVDDANTDNRDDCQKSGNGIKAVDIINTFKSCLNDYRN